MGNSWFRWERQACLHLLFPTLEAFYQPLQKYSGVAAPAMILVFERGIVTWCIREDEFIEYGNKLLQVYSDPIVEKKMVGDISRALGKLKKVESKIDGLDLVKMSDDQLIKVHRQLYQSFLDYYTMGAIGTPLSFSAEIILKNKGLSDEELNLLTTPDEITYVTEADNYLLKTKDIKEFIKKFFWIDNNYSGTEVISTEKVRNRLNDLRTKLTIVKNVPSQSKVKLDPKIQRLIELLKHYAIYKDNRKKEILIYLHFVDSILKEVGRRTGLGIEAVRASLPTEVGDLLSGKLTKNELDKRIKYSAVVWKKGKKSAQILLGDRAKEWERKTLRLTGIHSGSLIINGRTACPGKVTGRVRILLKASDCGKLKKGEVLVTFMTSPDFMPAIRKCSAIVTNLGGVTSHAAVISRELGVPCIVGTKVATQVLKDGDRIEVDADQGVVRRVN